MIEYPYLYPQLVLFGDSLLQRASPTPYPSSADSTPPFSLQAHLQAHALRRLDVLNRGLSGFNTSQALRCVPALFPVPDGGIAHMLPKIEYLVILFGANDAALPLPTARQGVPLETYKQNLRTLITHDVFAAHHPRKIIVVVPPPVDEIRLAVADVQGGHVSAMRTSRRTALYAQAARDVVLELRGEKCVAPDVVLVDLWQAIMERAIAQCPQWQSRRIALGKSANLDAVAAELGDDGPPWLGDPELGLQGGLESLLPDGLHMSDDGYKILATLLVPHIQPHWATLPSTDRSDYVVPDWKLAKWQESDDAADQEMRKARGWGAFQL